MNNVTSITQKPPYGPFVWVSVVWCALAYLISPSPWVFILWALSMLDLLALSKLVTALTEIYSRKDREPKTSGRVGFWALAKMSCLGLFAVALFGARGESALPLMLGLGTLVVVPLTGGFWWSQRELTYG